MPVINIQFALKSNQQKCGSFLEVEILLAAVLQVSREYLHTWPDQVLTPDQEKCFLTFVARRAQGEPVAYLLGTKEFWSLPLKVSNAVLIPRPETEALVQMVIEKGASFANAIRVLELGTGSGAIALALAKECPEFQITAVDNSDAALNIAVQNAKNLAISHITFLKSDWFSCFSSNKKNCNQNLFFDIIVGNPPYISSDDIHLLEEGLMFEPREALVSPNNGFYDLKKIIKEAPNYMASKGWLILEHGCLQANEVRVSMLTCGLTEIQTFKDLAGLDRISIGQKR